MNLIVGAGPPPAFSVSKSRCYGAPRTGELVAPDVGSCAQVAPRPRLYVDAQTVNLVATSAVFLARLHMERSARSRQVVAP